MSSSQHKKQYLWADSGAGMSTFLYSQAVHTGAAWVGNSAQAQISLMRPTVREELAYGLEQRAVQPQVIASSVDKALKQWGLESIQNQDPTQLSSGQTRRVAIASAVLVAQDTLYLDCPADGLDIAAVRVLEEVLANFTGDVVLGQRMRALPLPQADIDQEAAATVEQYFTREGNHVTLRHAPAPEVPLYSPLGKTPPGDSPSIALDSVVIVRAGEDNNSQPFSVSIPSFQLKPGEIVHLSGQNGSGKTTLLKVLAGLGSAVSPQEREVLESGKRPSRKQRKATMSGLYFQGTVQRPAITGWAPTESEEAFVKPTLLQEFNATTQVGRAQVYSATVKEVLDWAGLADYVDAHPLDFPSSPRRIASVVQAMLVSGEVLLLDEPTVGLDRHGFDTLTRLLDDYLAGKMPGQTCQGAVIFTSHQEEYARSIATRALAL